MKTIVTVQSKYWFENPKVIFKFSDFTDEDDSERYASLKEDVKEMTRKFIKQQLKKT